MQDNAGLLGIDPARVALGGERTKLASITLSGDAARSSPVPTTDTDLEFHDGYRSVFRFNLERGETVEGVAQHYVREWLADGKVVFVYFNNTMGNAIQNLEALRQYVVSG